MQLTPLFLWCSLLIANVAASGTTTAFHVYREHDKGDLRMWYMPSANMNMNPTLYNMGSKSMRIDLSPDLDVTIRVDDDYIVADTFSIYVNDRLQFVCYYDDDDHQIGNLLDIIVNEQAYTYSINAGSHASCTPASG